MKRQEEETGGEGGEISARTHTPRFPKHYFFFPCLGPVAFPCCCLPQVGTRSHALIFSQITTADFPPPLPSPSLLSGLIGHNMCLLSLRPGLPGGLCHQLVNECKNAFKVQFFQSFFFFDGVICTLPTDGGCMFRVVRKLRDHLATLPPSPKSSSSHGSSSSFRLRKRRMNDGSSSFLPLGHALLGK